MITRLGTAPRRPGITTAAFLDHWRREHADAAGSIPGLRSYVQLHPVVIDGGHALGYPGFDACAELEFDTVEDLTAGFSSATYRGAVREDEDRFVDKSRFATVLGERHLLSGEPTSGAVRLLNLVRRHPAVEDEELWSALVGPYAEAVSGGTLRHELLRPVASDATGRERNAYDVVDELAFGSAAAAMAWLRSPEGTAASLVLAGLVAGQTRFLGREHRVR